MPPIASIARLFLTVMGFLLAADVFVARECAAEPPLLPDEFAPSNEKVGPDRTQGYNRVVTPDNQVLTPAGTHIPVPALRPQALALSPNGKILAVTGSSGQLLIVDPVAVTAKQVVALPAAEQNPQKPVSDNLLKPDLKARISFTGLIFAPNGTRIFMSDLNGTIKTFKVSEADEVTAEFSLALPAVNAPDRKTDIPSGLALSADGRRLYVVLNLSNRLAELDAEKGTVLRTWNVGMAPYDVRLRGDMAYVSNWGGRRPEKAPDQPSAHAGQGTKVLIDPRTGAASEGSLSIIDLKQDKVVKELVTGRHASGLELSPDGKYLCVACAASDFVDVLDTAKQEFVGRIFPKQTPADLFGAAPNALCFSPAGDFLYVCNGSQNAVAIVEFKEGKGELEGLIPTGWYPGAIVFDKAHEKLYVGNIKGVSTTQTNSDAGPPGMNSHQYSGSLSLIPVPKTKEARREHTNAVLRNYRAPLLVNAFAKPRPEAKPRPVPERVGEPSVFQHVLYIIKENRTYDQVLGDMQAGDGDARLCVFGEKVTPNQHKLARDFVLLDNTYCSGILSADGHNWACSAITTDYLEKQFPAFPRSYPDGFEAKSQDALAWSPAGFIWDAALAKKQSVRIYGEFAESKRAWKNKAGIPTWTDIWRDWQKHRGGPGSEIVLSVSTGIQSMKPLLCPTFPTYDLHIPDAIRAEAFLAELKQFEAKGDLPRLMVMSLSNDHTAGLSERMPTPRAYVADHDLALGKIIEGLSKSKFWKDTCVIAIEDDPQAGWDHVSGYRTTAFVVSAWSHKRGTISTQYNQTSVLRTIELILGLPPMNQLDATATPMFDCFGDQPDFAPIESTPNQHPLDELTASADQIKDPQTRRDVQVSNKLPLNSPDQCPEDVLNRILWRSVRGNEPYPEWAVMGSVDDD